ncbi:Zn-dependent hydrolases of the beta-lactamase [Schizosaccharomyces osmophilus]|uniref:Zn-dependent hydrolases of the beta-lactamase n=1 Tax=Schizosaccharomyces osmophilus TaxID=2545709 RepID=A0AAF0AUC8_9SCHI|nr:Zn-dependent hydrolases of the beta-lactamase [Schizosaccharomyces osmophilus]WBW70835.1 Zn-dependent hydrolases of the beta-lactamase [Schizosaccharomyces osmophilus]
MPSTNFLSNVSITHLTTATAIFSIDHVNFLTDPVFSPAGTKLNYESNILKDGSAILQNSIDPALGLESLPPIDAVLLSHEDHADNLDDLGRRLLDGRKVITTMDGAKNLQPRPGVRGIRPWETIPLDVGGKTFQVTGVPTRHVPGEECTGFILECNTFGTSPEGLPNVIYFSGDTVYIEEIKEIRKKYHVCVAILNLGKAIAFSHDGPLQITLDGKQAGQLVKDLNIELMVPIHFEGWGHFTQAGKELTRDFEEEGISDRVCWVTPGKPSTLISGK